MKKFAMVALMGLGLSGVSKADNLNISCALTQGTAPVVTLSSDAKGYRMKVGDEELTNPVHVKFYGHTIIAWGDEGRSGFALLNIDLGKDSVAKFDDTGRTGYVASVHASLFLKADIKSHRYVCRITRQ